MAGALPSGDVPTPRLPRAVPLPRCHLSLSPVFGFSVVLGGQPRPEVEVLVEDSEGDGTVPGGKREEVLLVHVLGESTRAALDNGGGG